MKHSERLMGRVTHRYWSIWTGKNWNPPKHIKFYGIVESVTEGKVAECRLTSYQNDFDNYDIGEQFSSQLSVDDFPTEVSEGLIFEMIITDYEDFKKNNADSDLAKALPESEYTIVCKIMKTHRAEGKKGEK